jgi:transcriptional regulator with XRE-family HTH domain
MAKKTTRIGVYRTYRFIDKDPVIDKIRTVLQDEGFDKKRHVVSRMSGVSPSTLANWFEGATKRPQHATLAAVITAVGYEFTFSKTREIDEQEELDKAKAFRKRQLEALKKK